MPSPLHVVLGRRGARLAEVMTLSQNLLPRPSRLRKAERQKGVAAAAAAFAAAEAEAAAVAAAAGSKYSNGVSGSPSTSVVSAPDWPPVSQQRGQQQTSASDDDEERQQKRQRRKQQQQDRQQQDRQQQPAPAAAAQRGAAAPPPAGGGSGGSQQADLTAFLRSAGGASRLRLDAWEDVDPDAKRLKDSLLRKVCA